MKERTNLPYSPLDEKLLSLGLVANKKDDDHTSLYISIPSEKLSRLQFPEELKLYSELTIKFLNSTDVSNGEIKLPKDAYNLANFEDASFSAKGEGSQMLMPLLNGIYDRLSLSNSSIQKNQLVFSATEKTIYIFPTVLA